MSDGTIIFDTKIDESGAKQGYSKLVKGYKAQLKELEKEISSLEKDLVFPASLPDLFPILCSTILCRTSSAQLTTVTQPQSKNRYYNPS